MARTIKVKVFRGDNGEGAMKDYNVHIDDGMVVLDVVHRIQATQAPDLACRWNCKAGKCGSCSAEVNGKPSLMCMTRMDTLPLDKPLTIEPLKTFPHIRDLVTDVSWNYSVNKRIKPFKPRAKGADGKHRMYQYEVDRVQEFRKCIECYLCQTVCHVLRNHGKHEEFAGPRFMIRMASLEMHPLDTEDRIPFIKDEAGVGYCNITKCCTEVCPEHIHITDNGIIPLKERVADRYYDPIRMLFRVLGGK
ncbi:succinate dehydrogenase/fumarate reductase iron-sulfur subunit [bacterium]|nr:succinate dehydrogenase/fumarate reductase iron-sulfur subunit [bacterium]